MFQYRIRRFVLHILGLRLSQVNTRGSHPLVREALRRRRFLEIQYRDTVTATHTTYPLRQGNHQRPRRGF